MDHKETETHDFETQKMDLVKAVASISSENAMKIKIMELTHKYNETKDAAQTVIGALANIKGVTFKSLHDELNVPSES